jgi:TfdA family taurine catabolism dioxygenase TauD
MLSPIPHTAIVNVPSTLANELLQGAERLPLYDNKEFYSPELQVSIQDSVREANADGFDWIINTVRERVAQRPYCVLVKGLRFDEGNRLFVAINRAFGELVARPYEKPRAQLVHYVQAATDITSPRGGHETERLHTDTADWDPPVELISMICVRADPGGGGRSRVLDVDAIRDEMQNNEDSRTLELLETEPVPWQLAPYWGGGLKWRPVLTKSSVCWRRYTIEAALKTENASLSDEMLGALDAFEDVISNTNQTVDFLMGESELLFSDNWRTIHARTPLSNGVASDRLMIRSWIRTS